ncbi:MAG: hypothetical protein AAF799_45675 [Myxococcota bacterium]
MARSLQRIAEIWERERLAEQYPEIYAKVAHPFLREFALDLLDPGDVSKLGLDPSAPVGIALLDPRDTAVVFFGGLSDPELFSSSLHRLAGSTLPVQEVGEARVIVIREGFERASIVVRGNMFGFVFWSDGDFDGVHPIDYAHEVATVSPSGSLAHAEPMKKAHAALADDADLYGLLDPAGMLFTELEWSRRIGGERLNAAEAELANARSRGASADEIRNLQEIVNATRVELMAQDRERQLVNVLLSRTVGSIQGIGLSVNADERGLLGAIHIALTPDSVARELLVSDEAPPQALLSADLEPLFAAAGRVDVDVAVGLLAQVMLADGASYADLNEEIRRDTTLDFDRRVRPLLDGRAALMIVDAEPTAGDEARDVEQWVTGAMTVGVKDPDEARALLKQLEPMLFGLGWTKAKEIEGYTREMNVPDRLWLAVVDDQVVLASDLAMVRRIAEGKAGSASAKMPSEEAWARLTQGSTVFRAGIGHGLMAMTFFGLSTGFIGITGMAEAKSDVPMGRKVQKARERAKALGNQVFRLRQQQIAERARMTWRRLGALGMTIAAARMTETGVLIEGGHYVRGGMGQYVEALMAIQEFDEAPTSVDARLEKLRAEHKAARARFERLRDKEIERATPRAN